MKQNKHCKGCKTYEKQRGECGVYPDCLTNVNGECPCSKCLVKVICEEECEEYDEYWMGQDLNETK